MQIKENTNKYIYKYDLKFIDIINYNLKQWLASSHSSQLSVHLSCKQSLLVPPLHVTQVGSQF